MDIKVENEKKKEYLKGYRRHGSRIKRIEAELEEIRSMRMNPPMMNNDGMPHGGNHADLSNYAARLDELESNLCKEGIEQIKKYKEINSKINQVKNEDERDVLFYRYIKGLEWWDIAKNMNCSERQIYRIHGRALKNLKVGSPCQ